MQFRYDFLEEKLDLSLFIKQATKYISIAQLEYSFYFRDYVIMANISCISDYGTNHIISIIIYEIIRDNDNNIQRTIQLTPANDIRFKDIKNITDFFKLDENGAIFSSSNVSKTVKDVCNIVSCVFKINSLKAFF